jgi:hypothetical protein
MSRLHSDTTLPEAERRAVGEQLETLLRSTNLSVSGLSQEDRRELSETARCCLALACGQLPTPCAGTHAERALAMAKAAVAVPPGSTDYPKSLLHELMKAPTLGMTRNNATAQWLRQNAQNLAVFLVTTGVHIVVDFLFRNAVTEGIKDQFRLGLNATNTTVTGEETIGSSVTVYAMLSTLSALVVTVGILRDAATQSGTVRSFVGRAAIMSLFGASIAAAIVVAGPSVSLAAGAASLTAYGFFRETGAFYWFRPKTNVTELNTPAKAQAATGYAIMQGLVSLKDGRMPLLGGGNAYLSGDSSIDAVINAALEVIDDLHANSAFRNAEVQRLIRKLTDEDTFANHMQKTDNREIVKFLLGARKIAQRDADSVLAGRSPLTTFYKEENLTLQERADLAQRCMGARFQMLSELCAPLAVHVETCSEWGKRVTSKENFFTYLDRVLFRSAASRVMLYQTLNNTLAVTTKLVGGPYQASLVLAFFLAPAIFLHFHVIHVRSPRRSLLDGLKSWMVGLRRIGDDSSSASVSGASDSSSVELSWIDESSSDEDSDVGPKQRLPGRRDLRRLLSYLPGIPSPDDDDTSSSVGSNLDEAAGVGQLAVGLNRNRRGSQPVWSTARMAHPAPNVAWLRNFKANTGTSSGAHVRQWNHRPPFEKLDAVALTVHHEHLHFADSVIVERGEEDGVFLVRDSLAAAYQTRLAAGDLEQAVNMIVGLSTEVEFLFAIPKAAPGVTELIKGLGKAYSALDGVSPVSAKDFFAARDELQENNLELTEKAQLDAVYFELVRRTSGPGHSGIQEDLVAFLETVQGYFDKVNTGILVLQTQSPGMSDGDLFELLNDPFLSLRDQEVLEGCRRMISEHEDALSAGRKGGPDGKRETSETLGQLREVRNFIGRAERLQVTAARTSKAATTGTPRRRRPSPVDGGDASVSTASSSSVTISSGIDTTPQTSQSDADDAQ